MTLSVTSTIDQITILENGIIMIRTNNIITDNSDGTDVIVSQSYFRDSLTPGQELSNQPANIVAIANLTWTPEIISAYKASLQTIPNTGV